MWWGCLQRGDVGDVGIASGASGCPAFPASLTLGSASSPCASPLNLGHNPCDAPKGTPQVDSILAMHQGCFWVEDWVPVNCCVLHSQL